jgi:hypothetical protein
MTGFTNWQSERWSGLSAIWLGTRMTPPAFHKLSNSTHSKIPSNLPRLHCHSTMADAANLHLDDVTGERVSKSELKKRQKQRGKDAARAAAKPPQTQTKKVSAEEEESQLTPNVSVPCHIA